MEVVESGPADSILGEELVSRRDLGVEVAEYQQISYICPQILSHVQCRYIHVLTKQYDY